MNKWLITWSSANASGNITEEFPDNLRRDQIIYRWESAHYGCYVDRLEGRGPVEADN